MDDLSLIKTIRSCNFGPNGKEYFAFSEERCLEGLREHDLAVSKAARIEEIELLKAAKYRKVAKDRWEWINQEIKNYYEARKAALEGSEKGEDSLVAEPPSKEVLGSPGDTAPSKSDEEFIHKMIDILQSTYSTARVDMEPALRLLHERDAAQLSRTDEELAVKMAMTKMAGGWNGLTKRGQEESIKYWASVISAARNKRD